MSVINTNIQAISGARHLNHSQEMLGRSLTRLSSGSKIVNPSDDAAGLAVSEKLDAQGRRVRAATTNVQNAISYVQTADGFMSGMTKILSRMSELAILAKDVTKNGSDVELYAMEFVALQSQLRQTIGGSAEQIGGEGSSAPLGQFNGITLFGDDAAVPVSQGLLTTPAIHGLPTVVAGPYSGASGLSVGDDAVIATGTTFGANVAVGAGALIDGATLGDNVAVGKSAFLGAGVVVENNVTIGENAYIAPGVTLKAGTTIAPGAVVLADNYAGATVPAGSTITKDDLLGSVVPGVYTTGIGMSLGEDTVIGAGATFGEAVAVGDGARLADGVTVGNNVTIGKNVYIAKDVVIGNGVTIPDGAVILGNVPDDYEFAAAPAAVAAAAGKFDVTVGQAVGQTMTIPQINLRQGAMLGIIGQDDDGKFTLSLTAPNAIQSLTGAIQHIASERASLGASQSRLELASSTLMIEFENLSSAISRIRDVDVAEESTSYARYNILVQSGTAMLAQANQTPQSVLKLLQG